MKINPIKHIEDIRDGWHIRAVVNCHGSFWLEALLLTGRPRLVAASYNPKVFNWKILSKPRVPYVEDGMHYLSSFGLTSGAKRTTFLLRYSNRVWNHLARITEVRTFLQTLRNET